MPTLGELIDHRASLKTTKSIAQHAVDELDAQVKDTERAIMAAMEEAGVSIAAGTIARAAIKEETMPNVTDWGELHEYIRANNAFYLLQKRVSATAFRDTLQATGEIPGVRAVPVKSLSITTL